MRTGEKVRRYRKLRKLTQDELGEAAGITGNAIRNYEHDFRRPNEEQLTKIARKLDVSVEALSDYEVSSAREALEALFRLEDAFGLTPSQDGTLAIDPKAKGAQRLTQALKVWRGALDDVESGDMSADDYELWKASLRV